MNACTAGKTIPLTMHVLNAPFRRHLQGMYSNVLTQQTHVRSPQQQKKFYLVYFQLIR